MKSFLNSKKAQYEPSDDEDYAEKKKPAKKSSGGGSVIQIILILAAIVGLFFLFLHYWKSFTLTKIIFLVIAVIIAFMIVRLFGLNKGLTFLIAIIFGFAIVIWVIPYFVPNLYADTGSLSFKSVASIKKSLGDTICIIKNPADSQKCTAGEVKSASQINVNFPENIYIPGKALDITATLSVLMPNEDLITVTPQCYLGIKSDITKLETKIINNAKVFSTFRKKSSEQTASIKCSDATANLEKISGKNLIIDIDRTTNVIARANILIGPQGTETGQGQQVLFTSVPDSSILPYAVNIVLPGNQPFGPGIYNFTISLKKQGDFGLKILNGINITSILPIQCQDFKRSEKDKSTIYIENLVLQDMQAYAKAIDTYAFDCNMTIVFDKTEDMVEKNSPVKISVAYTTSKEFSTPLSINKII